MNRTFDIQLSRPDDFNSLVLQIQHATKVLQENARMVINRDVTARAWLTGFYIVEYEQNGSDRAQYGEQLLKRLSEQLNGKSFGVTSLKNYRQFYLMYPQLSQPLSHYLIAQSQKGQTAFGEFTEIRKIEKSQIQIADDNIFTKQPEKSQTVIGFSKDGFAMRLQDGTVEPVPQMLFDRQPDDNPPMGLLLCTEYGKEMVDYLTPFIDPEVFIAKYELQLTSKEKIQDFLMRENAVA